jgi:hypothetical protein
MTKKKKVCSKYNCPANKRIVKSSNGNSTQLEKNTQKFQVENNDFITQVQFDS